MSTSRLVPTIYGYLVCLVSIIVVLVSLSMIINGIFNLSDPLHSSSYSYTGGPQDLSSFEAYKISATTMAPAPTSTQVTVPPSNADLQVAYNSAKDERTTTVRLDAIRSITDGVILILAAFFLFIFHWRWLTRLNQEGK